MKPRRRSSPPQLASPALGIGALMAALLLVILLLPLVALVTSSSWDELRAGLQDPNFGPALWLSLRTSALSLLLSIAGGTPLAWWLARSRRPVARALEWWVELPIVIPPAVMGIALLQAFGRRGMLGPLLDTLGLELAFSPAAVVLAQVVVSAPFFVRAASNAFRRIDPDTLLVARTLGASPREVFRRVVLPVATPGLLVGASLTWARALGEFGATLLFAGNLPGQTQTLPLAIYAALERDLRLAVALSLCLAALASVLLLGLRGLPRLRPGRFGGDT